MWRIKAAQGTALLRTDSSLFQWTPHTDNECTLFNHFSTTLLGGRPKRQQPVGRQSGELPFHTLGEVAGAALAGGISPSRLVSTHVDVSHVCCILCTAIVDAPVQLSCDHLVCHPCIRSHIINAGRICPGCQQILDSAHISQCTSLVQSVIRQLQVRCKNECPHAVTIEQLSDHEAACDQISHLPPRGSLLDMTISEMMEIPLTAPLSCDEELLCSRLVRRSTQGGKELVIPTGGQVQSEWHYIYAQAHTSKLHIDMQSLVRALLHI